MKNNGFTLIELLAIMVILAVLSLITVPIITGIVNSTKKNSFENATYNLITAGEQGYHTIIIDEAAEETTYTYTNGVQSLVSGNINMNYNGKKPQNGTMIINTNGEIALAIHDGKYCVTKDFPDDKIVIVEKVLSECKIPIPVIVDESGANAPVLATGMTAVTWDEANWVAASNIDDLYNQNWYDYGEKKWANAKTADGSMWVWVPRYAYQITTEYHTSTAGMINIKFLQGTTNTTNDSTVIQLTPTYSGSSQTNYIKHPAFTFGTTELTGIWVAKFEMSGTTSSLNSKPGVQSLKSTTIGNMFTASRNMETNSMYGWTLASGLNADGTFTTDTNNVDTHMMKNIEWGAVAYLAQSTYGKNDEITINDSSAFYTGGINSYVTNIGQSTTGNIYGIYDMSGGSYEYVMGNYDNTPGGSGLTVSNINRKYIDIYTAYSNAKYGDAIYETSSSLSGSTSWYSDSSLTVESAGPWFWRGGRYNSSTGAGAFCFSYGAGTALNYISWRSVVLVGTGL